MKEILISVVIPVYNVSGYIHKCLESVINQTFHNLEIIVVDDGSTDNCPQICDDYACKDKRITIIHQKNGGLSDARNTGINIAKGEYITFVDSDDVLELDMIEYLYHNMIENNADLCQCQLKRIDEDDKIVGEICPIKDILIDDNNNCMKVFLNDKRFNTTAWAKLYKTSMFKDVRYPKGKYNEDVFTTYKLVAQCNRVFLGGERKYLYRIRSGSIMLETFKPKHMDGVDGKEAQCRFIEEYYPELAKYAHADIIYASNIRSMHMAKSGYLHKEYIGRLQKLYRRYEWEYLLYSSSRMSAKLFSIFAFISLKTLLSIIKILSNEEK